MLDFGILIVYVERKSNLFLVFLWYKNYVFDVKV
jgi:hypothetical protein